MHDVVTHVPASLLSKQRLKAKRQAFTLVELLVVIVIIAILIALLVPTIGAALTAAKNGRIGVEVSSLATAIKSYRGEVGAYPPDFAGGDRQDQLTLNAHLARKYRYRQPTDVPGPSMSPLLLNLMYGAETMDNVPGAVNLDPSEALVFWLSGFSSDPKQPIMGLGNRTPLMEFDKTRLQDADGDGFPEYYPRDSEQPYVYLQSTNYAPHPFAISTGQGVQAYKANANEFVEAEGFQIICAGLDNQFGAVGGIYPGGFGYTDADRDNITNFSEGKTLEDALP